VTAPAEPARPLLDIADALTKLRSHRELLERQQSRQSAGPSFQLIETAREINDTRIVERWLSQQLRHAERIS
jgi:hypothetical protein